MSKQKLSKIYLDMTTKQFRNQIEIIRAKSEYKVKNANILKIKYAKLNDLIIAEIYRREAEIDID